MNTGELAVNLRLICSTEASVSAVCRTIGINRQQFSKYLSGASTPSAQNMRKIAMYFGIRPAEFLLPPAEFEAHPTVANRLVTVHDPMSINREFESAFRGQTIPLRRYYGYYLSYFFTQSWENSIICALVRLDGHEGMVRCKSMERSIDPEDGSLYLSKYSGRAAMLGNRIFVLEFQTMARDALVETVLYPIGRGQLTYLRGTTFGITSRQRTPFTSPVVWRYLGTSPNLMSAMRKVGLYEISSPSMDQRAKAILLGSHTPHGG